MILHYHSKQTWAHGRVNATSTVIQQGIQQLYKKRLKDKDEPSPKPPKGPIA
jgi:hypothetical protein